MDTYEELRQFVINLALLIYKNDELFVFCLHYF